MELLPEEFTNFVSSVVNSYQSKAEQAWEFSEALQNDIVQPIRDLFNDQCRELDALSELQAKIELSIETREKAVKRSQAAYQKAAGEFNEQSTLLIRIRNFILVDSQLFGGGKTDL